MARPKGSRGSWFAKWRGNDIPCVHRCWTSGTWPKYRDPYVDDSPRWASFIEALRDGRTILTDDELDASGMPVSRKGYLSLWSIGDVSVSDGILEFEFRQRLEDFR